MICRDLCSYGQNRTIKQHIFTFLRLLGGAAVCYKQKCKPAGIVERACIRRCLFAGRFFLPAGRQTAYPHFRLLLQHPAVWMVLRLRARYWSQYPSVTNYWLSHGEQNHSREHRCSYGLRFLISGRHRCNHLEEHPCTCLWKDRESGERWETKEPEHDSSDNWV